LDPYTKKVTIGQLNNLVENGDQLNVYQDREDFSSISITEPVLMTGCKDLGNLFQFLRETYKPILALKGVQLHVLCRLKKKAREKHPTGHLA
jgi:hypothetical protein